jgi:DsbC/DsbD-like thiol-disulfide interchange protein
LLKPSLSVLAFFAALSGAAAQAAAVDTGHLQAELIAGSASAPPGGTIYVALRQKIDRGWHTYWRNSGDAGEATKIVWTLPPGWRAGPIIWARPQRLPLKPLMDYGYTGDVILPVAITVPAGARPGQTVTLKAAVTFLVCEDICVPEAAVLTLPVKVATGRPAPDVRWGWAVERALAAAPKPAGLRAVLSREGARLRIVVTGSALKGASGRGAYFFPYASTVISHAAPQGVERGDGGLILTLSPGYDFTQGRPPAVFSGVLDLGDRAYEITVRSRPAAPAEW